MDTIINITENIFAVIGGLLGWLLGGCDSLIYTLIAFVVFDYISGLLLAIFNRTLSSEVGFKGICRKALIFIVISVGNIIDKWLLQSGIVLRTMLAMFYLSNEGISIIENVSLMGVPIPQKLKDVLQRLNESDNNSK